MTPDPSRKQSPVDFQLQTARQIDSKCETINRSTFRLSNGNLILFRSSRTHERTSYLQYWFGLSKATFESFHGKSFFLLFVCGSTQNTLVLPGQFMEERLREARTAADNDYKFNVIKRGDTWKLYISGKPGEDVSNCLNNYGELANLPDGWLPSNIVIGEVGDEPEAKEDIPGGTGLAWIFQANPKIYDVRSAVRDLKEITFLASKYRGSMHTGNRVYLWQSGKDAGIIALGTVLGDPSNMAFPDNERKYLRKPEGLDGVQLRARLQLIRVLESPLRRERIKKEPALKSLSILKFGQGTNFPVKPEEAKILDKLIEAEAEVPKPEPVPNYSLADLSEDTYIDEETLVAWIGAIKRKKQAIILGPPGTGKTFVAKHLAKHLVAGGGGQEIIIQFHPAYSYEDFIQGIRPEEDEEGKLKYPMVPGVFLDFCEKARKTNDPSVLVIDEINRGNLAQIFGELMFLLEYRDEEIPLASGKPFRIPEQVYLIGTMNTADRSIALVDHALRRRFAFLPLYPNYEILKRFHQSGEFDVSGLVDVLENLNRVIADKHYQIGASYFLVKEIKSEIKSIWQMEIEPYLEEYFFDQPDKADEFRWDRVKSKIVK